MRCGSGKYMKMQGTCANWENGEKLRMGGHDIVRRVGRQGSVLIWCRKCSGFARHRMGMGTKKYGKVLNRILILGEGRIPGKRKDY